MQTIINNREPAARLPGALLPDLNDHLYASTVQAADVLTAVHEKVSVPELDTRYIKNIALAKGGGGESDVANYSTRSFAEHNAQLSAQLSKCKAGVEAGTAGIRSRMRELKRILDQTPPYLEHTEKTTPWTWFAVVQIWLLVLISLLLLGVGINTVAQVLIASGIRGFEQPWRAYLFSFVPVGLAVGIKYLKYFLPERLRKIAYPLIIWSLGLTLGLIWAVMFAQIFPSMTQNVTEVINNISVSNAQNPSDASWSFIVLSILAEAFLSAACWLTIEFIVDKHQSPVRIENPAHKKVQSDLDNWTRRAYEMDELRGKIEGKLNALDEAKRRFVEQSLAEFQACSHALRINLQT